jgi:ComF family protein
MGLRLNTRLAPTFNMLLDGLLPRQCLLCNMGSKGAVNICSSCQSRLPRITNPCHHCGIDMQGISVSNVCSTCLTAPWAFQRCIALYRYEGSARKLVTEFKFKAKFSAGKFLAETLAEEINAYYVGNKAADALLAIPLHYARLARRGYNQSLLLAQTIARLTDIPLIANGLSKHHATPAQSSLNSAAARSQNLRSSFCTNWQIRAQRLESVVVIDYWSDPQ